MEIEVENLKTIHALIIFCSSVRIYLFSKGSSRNIYPILVFYFAQRTSFARRSKMHRKFRDTCSYELLAVLNQSNANTIRFKS